MDSDVEIFEVEEGHDRPVGEGVIVHPQLVVVRHPLSEVLQQLTERPPSFRLSLPGAEDGICDVVAILVTKGDDPLVAMEISPAAPREAVWMPSGGAEGATEELREHVARTDRSHDMSAPSADAQGLDVCAIWPDASFCNAREGADASPGR